MGYIKHHTIVVVSWDKEKLKVVHRKARKVFKKHLPHAENLVSEIIRSSINDYHSFFVAPDGSKEGWFNSDWGDEARKEFVEYIKSLAYEDGSNSINFVELFFGEDDGEAEILDHN